MSCTPLTVDSDGAVTGWICGSRQKVVAEEDAGTRWCFNCRQHLPHTDVWLDDVEPSYYDPYRSRRCSRCHEDHTLFPGTGWL